MLLLVGLGNPGRQYQRNRHNIGFMAMEEIARQHGFAPFRSRFQGKVSEGRLGNDRAILLMPDTYMNDSGRAVQEELGLKVLTGTLPHPDLGPCMFDVVTMWHSLEHVHRPLDVLRESFRLLVPGGKLVVACPNIESLPFYWFASNWFGLDLPRHLTHFTPKTLRVMLETAGFRVERVQLLRHSDWLRSSAKLAVRHGGGLAARALTCKPVAKAVAWGCYAAGMSDCMMAVAERP